MIAMQISLYPLGKKDIVPDLESFWEILKKSNIDHKVTPLSTIVYGSDEDKIYATVLKAYRSVRKNTRAVMVTTLTSGTEKEIGELIKFL